MDHSSTATMPQSRIATVLRFTSGNFPEMFDFFLFGFYATYTSKAFFLGDNEVTAERHAAAGE